jgi:hypothetical protein
MGLMPAAARRWTRAGRACAFRRRRWGRSRRSWPSCRPTTSTSRWASVGWSVGRLVGWVGVWAEVWLTRPRAGRSHAVGWPHARLAPPLLAWPLLGPGLPVTVSAINPRRRSPSPSSLPQVSGINIGPVHKRDILRANVMNEKGEQPCEPRAPEPPSCRAPRAVPIAFCRVVRVCGAGSGSGGGVCRRAPARPAKPHPNPRQTTPTAPTSTAPTPTNCEP